MYIHRPVFFLAAYISLMSCHGPSSSDVSGTTISDLGQSRVDDLRRDRTLQPKTAVPASDAPMVGNLPYRVSTDAMGQAVIEVPFEVPPGANEFAPALSLRYRSNSADGVVGRGFVLAGLSSFVSRCPRTHHFDGRASPVTFTAADALCLDGERLLLTEGQAFMAGAEYRGLREQFVRVEVVEDLALDEGSVVVTTRDGTKHYYGGGLRHRAVFRGTPYRWHRLRSEDTFGNTIAYRYIATTDSGETEETTLEMRLKEVFYARSVHDPLIGQRVTVDYEPSTKPRYGYWHGAPAHSTVRVAGVRTSGHNGPIAEYRLDYESAAANGAELLTSVTSCRFDEAGDAECLKPTLFEWAQEAPSYEVATGSEESGTNFSFKAQHSVIADLNGDGTDEMLFVTDPITPNEQPSDNNERWQVWPLSGTPFVPTGASEGYAVASTSEQTVLAGYTKSFEFIPTLLGPRAAQLDGDAGFEVVVPVSEGCEEICTETVALEIDFLSDSHGSYDPEVEYPYATDLYVLEADAQFNLSSSAFMGGLPPRIYVVATPADFDGDRHADLLLCGGTSFPSSTWQLLRKNVVAGEFAFDRIDLGLSCSELNRTVGPVDFDHDGAAEILLGRNDGAYHVEPQGNYYRLDIHADLFGTSQPYSLTETRLPVDVIARFASFGCSNLTFFNSRFPRESMGPGREQLGDFNGDGLVDILRFEVAGSVSSQGEQLLHNDEGVPCQLDEAWPESQILAGLRTYINTGDGFEPEEWLHWWESEAVEDWFPNGDYISRLFAKYASIVTLDENRDGLTDFLVRNPYLDLSSDYVLFETGPGFSVTPSTTSFDWPSVVGNRSMNVASAETHQPALVFLSQQAVALHNEQGSLQGSANWRTYSRPDHTLNRVRGVTDGFGYRTQLEYGSLYNSSVHTRQTHCDSHQQCNPGNQRVVTRLGRDGGHTDQDVFFYTEYQYVGGKVARGPGGFLGFERVHTKDGTSKAGLAWKWTETRYHQHYNATANAYPFVGRPARTLIQRPFSRNGEALRQLDLQFTVYEVIESEVGPGYFVVGTHSENNTTEFSDTCADLAPCTTDELTAITAETSPYKSTVSTQVIDGFGNVLSTQAADDVGMQTVVYSDFVDNTDQWVLGLAQRVLTIFQPNGEDSVTREYTQSYDLDTRAVLQHTLEPNRPNLFMQTTFVRDDFGNITEILQENSEGKVRSHQVLYDNDHGITRSMEINSLGHANYFVHSSDHGHLQLSQDPNDVVEVYERDLFGVPTGRRTTFEYGGTGDGDVTTVTRSWDNSVENAVMKVVEQESTGQRTEDYYDRNQRLIRRCQKFMTSIAPHASVHSTPEAPGALRCVDHRYNRHGRLYEVTLPHDPAAEPEGSFWFSHDNLGRITYTRSPESVYKTTEYRPLLEIVRDDDGNETRRRFRVDGQIAWVEDALGTRTCYDYQALGHVRAIRRNCNGQSGSATISAIRYAYDDYGLPTWEYDPDVGETTYTYTSGFRELDSQTDALDRVAYFAYDDLGRKTSVTTNEGAMTFVWDTKKIGLLSSATSHDGVTHAYEYDDFRRVSEHQLTIDDATFSLGYEYDVGERVSLMVYPSGVTVDYIYDNAGFLRGIQRLDEPQTLYRALSQDLTGGLNSIEYGNGTLVGSVYDLDGRTQDIVVSDDEKTLRHYGYHYSNLGLLESQSESVLGQSQTYVYDALNRLRFASTFTGSLQTKAEEVRYDALGNILERTGVGLYSYAYGDEGNRTATIGSAEYTWEPTGQLQSRGIGEDIEEFSWTSSGMLREYFGLNTRVRHHYDAEYERVRSENLLDGSTTTFMAGLYRHRSSPKAYEARSLIKAGDLVVAEVIQEFNGWSRAESTQYVHQDRLGNPVLVTDEGGQILKDVYFEPFGGIATGYDWSTPASDDASSIDFTGHTQRLDQLVNMGARHFDTRTGRFISADPILPNPTDLQGLNRFSYVTNNPLTYVDPTGNYAEPGEGDSFQVHFTEGEVRDIHVTPLSLSDYFMWFFDFFTGGYPGDFGADAAYAYEQSVEAQAQEHVRLPGRNESFYVPFDERLNYKGAPGVGVSCNLSRCKVFDNPSARDLVDRRDELGTEVAIGTAKIYAEAAAMELGVGFVLRGAVWGYRALKTTKLASQGTRVVPKAGASIRNVNLTKGKQNCVNCAIATDATLKGRPASGLPGGPTSISVLEKHFGGQFGPKTSISGIRNQMGKMAPGSTGIVFGSRGSGKVGHVFNVVNQGGVVRFLDGQIGTAARLDGYKGFRLLLTP